ncbi:AzlD domain-containing protein [Nocardioides salsibiostraticola]
MTFWILIAVVAVLTAAIKAVGPVVLGGRALPPRFNGVIVVMPAAVLAALVVTSALADGDRLTVDATTVGVAVGGLLLWKRAPVLVAVLAAAVVTAGLRAMG